jgi:hypothetical protein
VHEALTRHPAIDYELVAIFGCAPPECSALKFLIKAPNGEQFRWETLFIGEQARFLALSDACTITRITSARSSPGPRKFDFPLRMAAFLISRGRSGAGGEKKYMRANFGGPSERATARMHFLSR